MSIGCSTGCIHKENRVREGPDVLINALALGEGDEALVLAGPPHRWWNTGPGDALVSALALN